MAKTFVSGTDYIADLDSAPLGFSSYQSTTAHVPTAHYGICLTVSNTSSATAYRWMKQLLFHNNGYMYQRQNINNQGWSNWVSL